MSSFVDDIFEQRDASDFHEAFIGAETRRFTARDNQKRKIFVFHAENSFRGDFSTKKEFGTCLKSQTQKFCRSEAHLTKSNILNFCKWINGVITPT